MPFTGTGVRCARRQPDFTGKTLSVVGRAAADFIDFVNPALKEPAFSMKGMWGWKLLHTRFNLPSQIAQLFASIIGKGEE